VAREASAIDLHARQAGDFAVVIGEHETEFAFDRAHAGRAHNVALAASLLDGAVVAPGGTFSFNTRVGERTRAAGFREAPEIHDGRLEDGIGGGVCQVATTLHIASLEAGMEIVEIRSHTLASHYADPGLDATVFYGRVDFRFRNPHAFPVRVRAHAEEGVLHVRFEGAAPVAPTPMVAHVARRIRAPEQIVEDASLPAGARRVVERGRPAVVVIVETTRPDGAVDRRWIRYDAEPRIVRVGTGASQPHD
jgi:vancomycin resistance protein YoaR